MRQAAADAACGARAGVAARRGHRSSHHSGRGGVTAAAGFSLLELLVVVAIIAALTGLALLAGGGGLEQRRGENELRRFALQLELLCDRAVIESRLLGMALAVDAWEGQELSTQGWRALPGDAAVRSGRLPAGWQWALVVERMQRELQSEVPVEPQLLCLPDGSATPFQLELLGADGEAAWRLAGGGRSRTTVEALP